MKKFKKPESLQEIVRRVIKEESLTDIQMYKLIKDKYSNVRIVKTKSNDGRRFVKISDGDMVLGIGSSEKSAIKSAFKKVNSIN